MRLADALMVQRGDVVSFVGAGGKTAAMMRLGFELMEDGWRVLATTTTRMAERQLVDFPHHVRWSSSLLRGDRALATLLDEHRFVMVHQGIRSDKVQGLPEEQVTRLIDEMNADILLIEADGARQMPLKAPRNHEPVIPPDSTIVVNVAGLDAIGRPLHEVLYNPEPVLNRYGFAEDGVVQPVWLAQILRDETLGLKNIPESARVVSLLNKADGSALSYARGRRAAQLILRKPGVNAVAIGAVKRDKDPIYELHQRVAAVVLAGGLSRRMGASKPLLPWGRTTVIERIIQVLIPFHLSEIIVVTGYKAEEVEAVLKDYPVKTVFNPIYVKGEMLSSLQTGIRSISPDIGSALVVLGDQPQMSPRVVHRVLRSAAYSIDTIVAPYYMEQRGHPLLIPRRFWSSVLNLKDGAPRDAINEHPITHVPIDNDSIIRDIDTPEQYAQEKRLAGLE